MKRFLTWTAIYLGATMVLATIAVAGVVRPGRGRAR
jgi:hypothetical protein